MNMLVSKNTVNNTLCSVQEQHTFLESFNGIVFKVSL